MIDRDPSREAFEKWWACKPGVTTPPSKFVDGEYKFPAAQTAWKAWQAAIAHNPDELEKAHNARREAQRQLADLQEKCNRIGLDIDRALKGQINEQSPIAGRLKLIAQKAGQWKPWPMG